MSKKHLIIYHANCMDGCAAAWAALKALDADTCELFPANYQTAPPDVTGYDHVYILDFSFPGDVLKQLFAAQPHITLIDHHKTAMEDLADWAEDPRVTFDMNHSGAVLAWHHFFPSEPPPDALLYVEDRDLWRWDLPDSLQVNTAIRAHGITPSEFDATVRMDTATLRAEGDLLLTYRDELVDETLNNVFLLDVIVEGVRYEVPACQASCLISEVGNVMLARFPDAPFSLSWSRNTAGDAKLSLRGHDKVDCGAIAKTRGGGGHVNAAGFVMPWLELMAGVAGGCVVLK